MTVLGQGGRRATAGGIILIALHAFEINRIVKAVVQGDVSISLRYEPHRFTRLGLGRRAIHKQYILRLRGRQSDLAANRVDTAHIVRRLAEGLVADENRFEAAARE